MIPWIRLAFRNLLRNRRRSLYTILAVAVGFAAINVFGGFTDYIFSNLRESFVYLQGNGHLVIFKNGALRNDTPDDPLQNLLEPQEIAQIREIATSEQGVIGVSEAMALTGMISNGDISTIYVGMSWIPSEKYAFQSLARGLLSTLRFYDGNALRDDLEYGIGVGRGLAKKLGSQLGSPVILMAPTVHGQINAVDAEVLQTADTAMELLEDKWVVMPLSLARALYDTGGASRVNLLLAEDNDLTAERFRILNKLRAAGLDVNIAIWRELSPFYVKVEQMFRVIFFLMFMIVSVIIVMSVVNTVSMAVLERSREIGTLRAMGARRSRIVSLFSLEGSLLGLFGCSLGIAILALVIGGIAYFEPYWTPPQMARAIPLEVYVVPEYLGSSAFFLTALSFVSGVFPARRVARRNIVEALGHA